MPRSDFSFAFCAAFVLLTIAACSSDPSDSDAGIDGATTRQEAREFTEEDKRVASALSLRRDETVSHAEGPYARALLCRHGFEVLATRLGDAGLSDQQSEAMAQARAYFARQLRVFGDDEGKTAGEISSDLEQTAEDNSNDSDSVRIAMSCLRRLQEGA